MEAGGSLRRQSSLVADSLRGAPSHLVDPATGPNRGGQNWGNSVIESGEIPLILVRHSGCRPGGEVERLGAGWPVSGAKARNSPARCSASVSIPQTVASVVPHSMTSQR